ncbi:iron chelate uptake ABC transporter family permease subunit [Phycicoccus sp. BSK3Z-2]|uniref:Iron chelate uptake ABC transporter family permease subunit n=1 Tax=Phycicoccus avicenniae TaxID=2828860 RepID=A0A941DAW0_9MICO|nr:iron chelate uptake ABC transporter family permease subunit [Phycicoccus avicenniae]MBR7744721.1 iron chelate uptake ABC transporter family permease subunit [Phycicoccus avicenniae]
MSTVLDPSTPLDPGPAVGPSSSERARRTRVRRALVVLVLVLLVGCAAHLLWDLRGSWAYALDLRSRQLGALVVVGAAVGASSLAFQTVAGSRILTPGVMGFDTLYVLIQTVTVFAFGAGALQLFGVVESFVLDTALLTVFGVLLFRWLFRRHSRNLFVLVLVGIVLGSLFASLSTLASRMLSPDDYLTLQAVLFASFTTVDVRLLLVCAATSAAGLAALVPLLRRLDVVDLGRDAAVALGVDYRRTVTRVLVVVTLLVATSTALVGPMLFLGLLVANLTRQFLPTHTHVVLVPAAAVTGAATTVLGQVVVTHVLDLATPLSVVVNLVGGVYFLVLLLRSVRL